MFEILIYTMIWVVLAWALAYMATAAGTAGKKEGIVANSKSNITKEQSENDQMGVVWMM